MRKKIKKFIPKVIGWRLNMLYRINPEKSLQKLYELFVTPRRGKLSKEELPPFLNGSSMERILVDDVHLQIYRWKNEGERILLVHGWESNSARWEKCVKRLHELGYEVIAFDAPAHGLSEGKVLHVPLFARCIAKVQEKFKTRIAVGHSAGAMSLIYHEHAHDQQNAFKKLVLLGAPSEMTRIINDMAKVLGTEKQITKELDNFFKQKFGFYFHEFSIAEFAKTAKANTLVMHDKYDRVANANAARDIARNLENGQLIITEGQGHSLNSPKVIDQYVNFIHQEKAVAHE
jgi:pimeloyl-ACP methyl ester carboxylesterase